MDQCIGVGPTSSRRPGRPRTMEVRNSKPQHRMPQHRQSRPRTQPPAKKRKHQDTQPAREGSLGTASVSHLARQLFGTIQDSILLDPFHDLVFCSNAPPIRDDFDSRSVRSWDTHAPGRTQHPTTSHSPGAPSFRRPSTGRCPTA